MAKADFSKLKYNPFTIPRGAAVGEHYPALGRRAAFSVVPHALFKEKEEKEIPSKRDLSLLLSFIILFCEPGSPFYEERDFGERRAMCLQALGVDPESLVGQMIAGDHWYYAGLLAVFLRLLNSSQFDTWLSLKTHAEQMKTYLRQPIAGKIDEVIEAKTKIATQVGKLDKELAEVEKSLFRDRSVMELVNESVTADAGMAGYAELYALEYPS